MEQIVFSWTMADGECIHNEEDASLLENMRNTVVEFQNHHGISAEPYSFKTLLYILINCLSRAFQAAFHMIMTLLPMSEIFIHVVRFILDHITDIVESDCWWDKITKTFLFIIQITAILCILVFVFGTILIPLCSMAIVVMWKVVFFFTGS